MLAFMGLMGDVERLMNEDSVAAMLEGIEAAFTEMTEEYTYDYGEYEGIEIPTVTVPDNFVLVDGTQLYGYESLLDTSVYRDGADLLSVTIAADSALQSYLDANMTEEEAAAPSLPRDVSIDIREDYARAIVLRDEYTIVIEAFNGAADYFLLGEIIAGIEFPAEEEADEDAPAAPPASGKGFKGKHTL